MESKVRYFASARHLALSGRRRQPCLYFRTKKLNTRKGQWTNQKYLNLVGADQQMQRLELKKLNLERLIVRLRLTVKRIFQCFVGHEILEKM